MVSLNPLSQTMVVIMLWMIKYTQLSCFWLTFIAAICPKAHSWKEVPICVLCHFNVPFVVTWPRHTSSLFTPRQGCKFCYCCHLAVPSVTRLHPSSTYIILLYIKTLYNTSAKVYMLCFRISLIYLHLVLSNTSWHGQTRHYHDNLVTYSNQTIA